MNWLDAIFAILLIVGALRGLLTGRFLPLLIVFAVWVTSIALAVNFQDQLGRVIGDFSWAPLLAFFIIWGIVQIILYASQIPVLIQGYVSWRPQKWLDSLGGMLISTCISAIIYGIIWLVLWEIALQVSQDNAFYDLVEGSALRPKLTAFVDWFAPPTGIVLGSIIGAALVSLAAVERIRGKENQESE